MLPPMHCRIVDGTQSGIHNKAPEGLSNLTERSSRGFAVKPYIEGSSIDFGIEAADDLFGWAQVLYSHICIVICSRHPKASSRLD